MAENLPDSLKGIELTEQAQIPQRDWAFETKPEILEIIMDPPKRLILKILRTGIEDTLTTETVDSKTGERIIRQKVITRNALSVAEIVKSSVTLDPKMALTKNQVYHHLPKLIEVGYLIKYGVVTTGKRTTDYYRRTARAIALFPTPNQQVCSDMECDVKKNIRSFGLGLTEKQQDQVVELIAKLEAELLQGGSAVIPMIRSDVVDHEAVDFVDTLLWIYAITNPRVQELAQQIRTLIFSKTPTAR